MDSGRTFPIPFSTPTSTRSCTSSRPNGTSASLATSRRLRLSVSPSSESCVPLLACTPATTTSDWSGFPSQISGMICAYTRRFKWLLVAGLTIRLIGCGVMIHARGGLGSDFEVRPLPSPPEGQPFECQAHLYYAPFSARCNSAHSGDWSWSFPDRPRCSGLGRSSSLRARAKAPRLNS